MRKTKDVVRLEDLAPRKAVKGGGRLLFGERPDPPEDEAPPKGEHQPNPSD